MKKLIEQRPGELFLLFFLIGGIVLTLTVTLVEPNSGVAGRAFDNGLINGAAWAAEKH